MVHIAEPTPDVLALVHNAEPAPDVSVQTLASAVPAAADSMTQPGAVSTATQGASVAGSCESNPEQGTSSATIGSSMVLNAEPTPDVPALVLNVEPAPDVSVQTLASAVPAAADSMTQPDAVSTATQGTSFAGSCESNPEQGTSSVTIRSSMVHNAEPTPDVPALVHNAEPAPDVSVQTLASAVPAAADSMTQLCAVSTATQGASVAGSCESNPEQGTSSATHSRIARRLSTYWQGHGDEKEEALIIFEVCSLNAGEIVNQELGRYTTLVQIAQNMAKSAYLQGFLGVSGLSMEDGKLHLLLVSKELGFTDESHLGEEEFLKLSSQCREHANNSKYEESRTDVVARTQMIFDCMDIDGSGEVTENEFGAFYVKRRRVREALGFSKNRSEHNKQIRDLCGGDQIVELHELYVFVANHVQGLNDAEKKALHTAAQAIEEAKNVALMTRHNSIRMRSKDRLPGI